MARITSASGQGARWGARITSAIALALASVALAACGSASTPLSPRPASAGASVAGFAGFATKNTTRVPGADPTADAAAVAQAVYPGVSPAAVALVDRASWQAGVAAAVLMAAPLRAPMLLTDGAALPRVSSAALTALAPTGARQAGGAQALSIGAAARPGGLRTARIAGSDAFSLAAAIDRFMTSVTRGPSSAVVIASADAPQFALPAAAWAAKSGDPVLFVHADSVPAATRAAIAAHGRPHIYVLGPPAVIDDRVLGQLAQLGTVRRVGADDPVANAIAFARFSDAGFGWGVTDPGHGLVFVNAQRPLDAAAAAPLSASGTYGPLLLLDDADQLPATLVNYLLDIQPGYSNDPVRGVYNHGWLIGDASALSVAVQSRIDALLEIAPVNVRGQT